MENQDFEKKEEDKEPEKIVKEIHHHHHYGRSRFGAGRLFFGIIIILIGFMYLGRSLGILPVSIGINLWQYWPLAIILAGLSILSGRGIIMSLANAILVLFAAALIYQMFFTSQAPLKTTPILIEKNMEASSTALTVKAGAGKFSFNGGSNSLISGELKSNVMQISADTSLSGNVEKVFLTGKGSWNGGRGVNEMDLKLSPDEPFDLNFDLGASETKMDFTDVDVNDLEINIGASKFDLIIGDKAESAKVNISAGASAINISLPKNVGVKLKIDSGLSSKEISDFTQTGDGSYESTNYAFTEKKIDMNINAGASSIKIGWYAGNKIGMKFNEAEARLLAEKYCVKGGETVSPGNYNEETKTWWFDANLNATKPGCNPACVVSEETGKAELNWRCTGLIVPEVSAADAIRELFRKKYPKYASTISVKIGKETMSHARGSVSFVTGAPGGIFLAAKIDGAWTLVYDGNGAISCTLSNYGFPEDMLSDCY